MAVDQDQEWEEALEDVDDKVELGRYRRAVENHSTDLHCIDVSTYGPIEYEKKNCTKYNITLEKIFEPKNEKVSIFFLVQNRCTSF